MSSLRSPETRQRFVAAVREALRAGDKERFEELMAWAADQPISAPSVLELRERWESEARRIRDEDWPPPEHTCYECGATYIAECGYCRRRAIVEERHHMRST